MNVQKKLITSIIVAVLSVQSTHTIMDPVIEFIKKQSFGQYPYSLRQKTLTYAIFLMNDRNVKTIIETGTCRGGKRGMPTDGGFTILAGYWSSLNNAELYTVDINATALKKCQEATQIFEANIHYVESDSVIFLKNFDKMIDFLYLDSFDFDARNPEPSQMHHLYEIEACYEKLSPNAVIMIDDCGLAHGGKGKFAIEYLLKKGWQIYIQGYQVIMVRS